MQEIHDARDDTGDASGVHQLFEARAARTPEAVALVGGGERLTYGELGARVRALAGALRRRGVGAESLVGLAAERSVEMVVGLLGVLTAGGAYVPLDPAHPRERLAFTWRDAQQRATSRPVLLTTGHLAAALPPELADGAERVLLDGGGGDRAAFEPPAIDGDQLAYVIYTSGSTGLPKGVAIAHRGVVNLVREAVRLLRLGPGCRMLQLATLSFDASVLEIFSTLAAGACLVLTPRETLLSGEALGAELARHRITTLAIPPSLLDKVPVAADARREYPELASIVVGGEACSAATAARWAPGRHFLNAYAPTEATVFTTAMACQPPFDRPPAMGWAIAGTRVEVRGQRGRPLADGETGELCLGGAGIARGYLHRAALTAASFVPDPAAAGARLYRSGDLARRRAEGSVEFVGRMDTQVKVRGVRIELGEVESVLGRHPAVRSAVAVVDGEGEAGRLVAYLVPAAERPVAGELRAWLAARLPEPMVPAAFVVLDAFPMTPTGKIDRGALPAPGRQRPEIATPYTAPRGRLETALAAIWGELLALDEVGADDDLFELGGHSLVAAQIVSRVRQELGRELPLTEVFDHPTVAGLARVLEREVPEHRAALPPPIDKAPRGRPIPLSFPQERIWFLLQLAPQAVAYNFQFTLRLKGELDPAVLERALGELVRRHEVLRTTFPAVDGRPRQVVHGEQRAALPVGDLTALPEAAREAAAERGVREEMARAFDVTELPLLRWRLWRLGPRDHLFLQVEHHFVHDGWSLAIYLRELRELYEAFHRGRPSPLSEPPVQYADFAVWQRRWLRGEALAHQLDYWRRQLAGSPPLLELPADRPRPRSHSFRGGCLRVDLPGALYGELREASRRLGTTLFMAMLAAFDVLTYRYTGQRDFLLGSGLANRRLRELEQLVGMVVNTVVLRATVCGDMTLPELLAQVRRTMLEAHDHQDLPFEKLVAELQPDRDLSRNPLFQVLFSFHDAPVPDLDFSGLAADLFEWHNGSAKAELNVVVKPLAEQRVGRRLSGGEQLTMVWEYSADVFDAATVERMWHHYRTLLGGIVDDPSRRLRELPLLTAAERRQLAAWNPPPSGETPVPVHEQVAARAAAAADAVAVADPATVLSYGELAARAGRLAAALAAHGVGPETVVAIATGRRAEMVVAALAVLAAGGAYLPLDPAYPRERLELMLDDSGAAALLLHDALRDRLPATAIPTLEVNGELPPAAPRTAEPAVADALAYVIYTSGSTGMPKGVELCHRGLAQLVAWHHEHHEVTAADRATVLAGPAFDASVWELWPYLAAGASLHVADAAARSAPDRLLDWLARERVTRSFLATPLAEAVMDAARGLDPGRRPSALTTVLTGGDRLDERPDPELGWELVNHYGPTESTVVAAAGVVDAAAPEPPPIGTPILGTRAYVADRDFARVPVGVPGELLLAGRGLARGYRRRPALTAAAFVPDPWAGEAGDRLYRTGDLVRYLADGRLDFLGRIDSQVQIRGFRVELGEVHARLRRHPAVREAEVVARPLAGAQALVAYVVPAAGELDADALRAFLAEALPDYMVPAAFVVLEELPLTPNGKVDRRALPEPDAAAPEAGPTAPRTPLEELVATIWRGLLECGEIGVHASFFDLGGHSLLATRVLARLRDAAGVEVPIAELFEAPTVAGLARAAERRLRGREATAEPIPRRPPGAAPPLAFGQERLWFLEELMPGRSAYNVARAWELRGPLDAAALAAALAVVVRRHETLRTTFTDRGGRPVQVIADAAAPRLAVVDLRHLPAPARRAEVERRRRADAARPFRLDRGPLLRLTLLRTAAAEHVLLLAMHHVVSDGWSMGVLQRELGVCYGALAAGAAPRLPELPIQYGDFAAWQRRRVTGEVLAGEIAYWRERLRGAPALLELPTDRPRPAVQGYRGGEVRCDLPADLTARLEALCRDARATPFMALLAVFAALAHRYSGRSDVVIGTPIAGRQRTETEGLIGFFVNTLALRLGVGAGTSFRDLLRRAREATLGAHAHQEAPFEKLLEELDPERSLGHSPLFQVLFTVATETPAALELAGVEVAELEVARRESRFDLELSLRPTGDGMAGALRYDSDLFLPVTARRMTEHFRRLLAAALADPHRPVARLELMTPAERRQVVDAWSLPAAPEPERREPCPCLHDAFAAQVARTPDAEALAGGGERLTYRDLARRVHRLARELRGLGVGPEVPVAVLLERSAELVTALLAVLEAGGCYVPLDPAYPAARTRLILHDTRAPVIVTQSSLAGTLPPYRARTVVVDAEADRARIAARDAARPIAAATAEHLAYVIYTSGSTGRPKGVAIAHRSAASLVRWAHGVYGAEQLAGVLAATSVCFDLSVFELFVPLTAGGKVVLAPDVLSLAELPARGDVTLVNTVPSAMAELLRLGALPPSARTVNLAGEPLKPALVDALYEHADHVFDLYGPSEDTTYSTFTRREAGGPETVGRPVSGTRAFLCDRRGEPVPAAVPGEICLAGDGLARGYWGRPAPTAERFVPDAFGRRPGARLYRTGDLARRAGGGDLVFLGRLDHQVKVRGFRVELGEIETELAAHENVREAVAVARGQGLAAYVAPQVDADALADHLAERLPAYMVPAAIVALDALPRTPNGKVDRGALPAPEAPRRDAAGRVAPRNELETRIAEIWAEVLDLDDPGVEESFFKLGGHSLKATRVMARLRRELDVELALRAIFEAPTIAALADRVERQRAAGAPARPAGIRRAARRVRRRPASTSSLEGDNAP